MPFDAEAPQWQAPEAQALPRHLLDVRTIYMEPAVEGYARGREVLARFPEAQRIEVPSHWNIPGLNGNPEAAKGWLRTKRQTLVLGVKKGLSMRPNGRSAHFIAPSVSNGCALACAYCYVPRRKGFANPITLFVNIDELTGSIRRHAQRQGPLPEPDQIDEAAWVYDIGENADLSVDALLCDNPRDLVALFRTLPNAKGSFATKYVNRDLLGYDPQGHTRLRMSLMPERLARLVDVRTSPIPERLAMLDDVVAAGYELHLNFSPVILHEGWEAEYRELFAQVDSALGPAARAQVKAEVIFLTHNAALHEVNLRWHPKAESVLWRPDIQETKRSEGGMLNLRYRSGWKGRWLGRFKDLLAETMPYCPVRYAF